MAVLLTLRSLDALPLDLACESGEVIVVFDCFDVGVDGFVENEDVLLWPPVFILIGFD